MTLLKKNTSLFPRSSFFNDFFDDDRFWNYDFGTNLIAKVPSANVQEDEKEFVIELAVPGMEKKDFNIEIDNGYLTISSEKKEEKEEEKDNYSRKEFSYSSFSRSFMLPESVDDEKINASYKDGILKLDLYKKPELAISKKKAISVK